MLYHVFLEYRVPGLITNTEIEPGYLIGCGPADLDFF